MSHRLSASRLLLVGCLAPALALLAPATAQAQPPEEDKSFFRVNLSYTFDEAESLPRSSFFRTYVQMRDLFFLDSDDVEMDLEFYSPLELKLALSKWSFLDYRLAIGLEYDHVISTNVDAQTIEGNSYYIKQLSGHRFAGALFMRYVFAPGVAARVSYGLELNRYGRTSDTPAAFVLPRNNTGQIGRAAFRAHRRLSSTLDWIADAQFTYVRRNQADRYGVMAEFDQLATGQTAAVRGYLDYRGRWISALGGASVLHGSDGALRIGSPLVLRDRYEDVLSGFSERAVSVTWGLLHRGAVRSAPLFGFLTAQLQYAFLAHTDSPSSRRHVQHGWGAGLEVPLPIPYIGLYHLSVVYQQAHRNIDDAYHPGKPDSFQILASLYTFGAW